MKTKLLLALWAVLCCAVSFGQNVNYTTLYTNATFNRSINQALPVGTLGGEGSTVNGAGTYSVPIAVPPGTNGIAPTVSIDYNSQFSTGQIGVGWNITGLSVLTRAARDKFHDGQVGPVELSLNDRFALDGIRLVGKTGTYGTANSTYGAESEDFSAITAKETQGNGPKWFEVVSKDGLVMEFGNTADSRFLDQAGATVIFWRLNKIKYPDGNYIEYIYTNVDRDSRISEIRYTGNSAAGLSPYNKIIFEYKIATDSNSGASNIKTTYEAGSSMVSKYLLDKITVKAETDVQVVKTYQFNYGWDKINSYLKEVIEGGSDGTLLNSTIFKYGDLPQETTTTTTSVPAGSNIESFSGDYDGDGIDDVLTGTYTIADGVQKYSQFQVYKRTASNNTYTLLSTTSTIAQSHTRTIGPRYNPTRAKNGSNLLQDDYTGDGLSDVLALNIEPIGGILYLEDVMVYKSTNAGTSFTPQLRNMVSGMKIPASKKNYFIPGDFNGDGLTEFITILGTTSDVYTPTLHSDFVSNAAPTTITLTAPYNTPLSSWLYADTIQVVDFNGDGKQDLLMITENTCEIFTFNGAVASRLYYSGTFLTKNHEIYFGDFNGDRKTDILAKPLTGGFIKAISTGTTFIQSSLALQQSHRKFIQISDFNGDGKSDIYHDWWRREDGTASRTTRPLDELPETTGQDIYYSQGDTFHKFQIYQLNDPNPLSTIFREKDLISADINGDGRADLVSKSLSSSNFFSTIVFRGDGQENLLQKVTNGLNHTTEWVYQKLSTGGTFYTKGSASTYPLNNIQPALFAVSEIKTPTGIGGTTSVFYTYEEGKLHRAGKGFLGFKKVTETNQLTGVKNISESEFNTTFYASAPYKSSIYQGAALLSETTFSNEFVNLTGGRYWLRTNGTTENRGFEGRTGTVTNIYDTDGNITKSTAVVKNTSDAFNLESRVTDAVYQVIGALPRKSKPSSVTVTNTRNGQPAFGVTTAYGYNSIGQLTSKTEFSGLAKSATTTYGYNSLGNLTSTTLAPASMTQRVTSNTYDTRGRFALTSTNALNQTSVSTYDGRWGKPLTTNGIDGLTTTYEYDVFGKLKKTNLPEGYSLTLSVGWDLSGNSVWYTLLDHPGRPNVKTWHDVLARPFKKQTETFGGQWVTQEQTYDSKGNVISSTQPFKSGESYLTTNSTYDGFNRLASVSNATGTITYSYSYLNGELTTQTTNAANQVRSVVTDATGKTIRSVDSGGTLHHTYNSNDKIIETKLGSTIISTMKYDAYGRQTELVDKNAGTTTYEYDALSQIVKQTNPKGQTTMTYNLLGQDLTRTGPEGTTSYEYYPSGTAAVNKVKKITSFTSGNTQDFTYNNLGRVLTEAETIDGSTHTVSYEYNANGDVTKTTYPSGFETKHAYDSNGFLSTIKNGAENVTLYTSTAMNGLGQITAYSLGNGKSSANTYTNGFPTKFETSGVQNLVLSWNYASGNLTSRNDARPTVNKTETFTYDNLNRLLTAAITGVSGSAITTSYAPNGNISTKTDAGAYEYHASMINAMTAISNPSSVVSTNTQDIAYNSFRQPISIKENNISLSYTYGADYERVKSVLTTASGNTTKYYFGGYEKLTNSAGTKHIHYISSPAGLVAIVVRQGTTDTYHYTYTDHLGSILAVTNSAGAIEVDQNFDAWGRRRNPTTWALLGPTVAPTPALPDWLYRGYTGHEHLDNFGLINMNGRLYDPVVGRMLSPDNYVQEPDNSQSFNRYTYALNNPLVYTDPDGEFWNFVIGAALGGFSGYKIGQGQGASGWELVSYTFAGAVIGAVTAGFAEGVLGVFSATAQGGFSAASIGAYAASGAVSGALSGGAFAALGGQDVGKGALLGGIMGGMFGAVNGYSQFQYQAANDARLSSYISDPANWIAETGAIAKTVNLHEVTVIGHRGVGQPGLAESLIPVWGSGRAAVDYFQNGNVMAGLGYTVLAVSDVFLVKALATAAVKGSITLAGKYAMRQAVRNPVLTVREAAAAQRLPRLAPLMEGKGIDRAFRETAAKNWVLNPAKKFGLIQISPMNRGADIVGKGVLSGTWWDVTTKAAWGAHVTRYKDLGTGIGLFYR